MRTTKTLLLLALLLSPPSLRAEKPPVFVGFDGEFGHQSSTSAEAIKRGILVAIDEINEAGGVLGGRKLQLVEKDNRSVPARGVENIRLFAAMPDLVATFVGKFSPVVIESIPVAHEVGMPLLDPWAAADEIVDNGRSPNYVFRLSLKDGWAMPALMRHADAMGITRLGVLAPNTAWGRSSLRAAEAHSEKTRKASITGVQWYNWGDTSLTAQYRQLRAGGAQAILLVANEKEGSLLVKEIVGLPAAERLPLLSHWGVSGGDFRAMTGPALDDVDFRVVQTFTFAGRTSGRGTAVLDRARKVLGITGPADILSQVGFAHAYDLTHILARAIDKAGGTDRAKVRDALEAVGPYEGLVRRYDPPFTPARHEALGPEDLFVGRFGKDGIMPIGDR